MLADHEITRDELFAVGATFTLAAWAFAYTYTVWRGLVMLEQLAGIAYVAMVVSRLVGLLVMHRRDPE